MPRNRYTKIVNKELRARTAMQEKELVEIASSLRAECAPAITDTSDELKQRRRVRLAQKQLHKPQHPAAAPATGTVSSSTPATVAA